jgi:putative transposase
MLEYIPDWRTYLAQQEDGIPSETIQRHLRTGRPLGTSDFIEKLEKILGRSLRPLKPGPKSAKGN